MESIHHVYMQLIIQKWSMHHVFLAIDHYFNHSMHVPLMGQWILLVQFLLSQNQMLVQVDISHLYDSIY